MTISSIPQITEATIKTAIKEVFTTDTDVILSISSLETIDMQYYAGVLHSYTTETSTTSTDWINIDTISDLDVSEYNFLKHKTDIYRPSFGQSQVRIITNSGKVLTIALGSDGYLHKFMYTDSGTYVTATGLADVRGISTLNGYIQLRSSGGDTAYTRNNYLWGVLR